MKISECVQQRELGREHDRVLIIVFLGWKIHEDQSKDRWWIFKIFTSKVVFKPVPFLPLYFNCPVFTPDDYILTTIFFGSYLESCKKVYLILYNSDLVFSLNDSGGFSSDAKNLPSVNFFIKDLEKLQKLSNILINK